MMRDSLLRAGVHAEHAVTRLTDRARGESGQGTVEYLGILVAIGVLLIAVKTGMKTSIATKVTSQIADAIESVKI